MPLQLTILTWFYLVLLFIFPAIGETVHFDFENTEQLSNWQNLHQLSVPIACSYWNSKKNRYEGDNLTGERALLASGQQLARLGGDYWQVPIPLIGQQGDCRLDTWYRKTDHLNLISPEFAISHSYLSFLLNGGGHSKTSIQLQIKHDSTWQMVYKERGSGVYTMQRFNWPIEKYRGKTARILIADKSDKLALFQSMKKRHEQLTSILKQRNKQCRPYYSERDKSNDYLNCLNAWEQQIEALSESALLNFVPWIGIDDIRLVSIPVKAPQSPVWGAADLHLHLFTEYAFGGEIAQGTFNGPMSESLAACKDHGRITEALFGHDPQGYPSFSGWPSLENKSHQQAHVDWLYRAWKGGLRLIIMDASNNEFLRVIYNKLNLKEGQKYPSDDQNALELQIKALFKWLSSPQIDWAEMALTPTDARRIIAQGKLVVIPGVEMDRLAKPELENSSGDLASIQKNDEGLCEHIKTDGN